MKERLTGAIILVALLVLLVPELLTGPGPEATPLSDGSEGAPLRSYTIDLADDAARRTANAPTSTPSTAATDEPAGQAVTDPAAEAGAEGAGESGVVSPEGDSEGVAASSGTSDAGSDGASERTSGSGADAAAASPPGSSKGTGQESAPGVDDDRPRSAFGPNAVTRAPAEAARSSAPATGSSSRPSASEPRRAAQSESSRTAAEPRRAAASESSASKGWAVQLGVFASRENAERLAKQIKGKGYTVTVNETSGNGKRLYRVRVGPEADRSTAVALGAKLRAAGHTSTVVAW